jgi:M6 family metalloprotease-like protein
MEHVNGNQKFAVLLCRLEADTPVERQPREFFEDLFVNNSEDGLNRYWQDASHGSISLDGSQVFGWRKLPQTLAEFIGISDRIERIRKAAEHFAKEGNNQVDFRSFTGIIVVTDQEVDLTSLKRPKTFSLNGEDRPYRVVICSQFRTHEAIAHEMGHSFGLDHSFSNNPMSCDPANDGRPGCYCDDWDIMSGQLSDSIQRPRFGHSGPLMNAANMSLLGWLSDSRVRSFTGNSDSMQLRPLSRPDLPGELAIRVDDLLVEFRVNKGWDEGFGKPGVLVHKVDYQDPSQIPHSVVLGWPGTEFLQEADSYAEGDPRLGPYVRISVTDIDPVNESATIGLLRKERVGVPDELGILQWIVEGIIGVSPQGRVVIVPPRPPLRDILIGVAMNEMAQSLADDESRAALSRASMNLIAETARKDMDR